MVAGLAISARAAMPVLVFAWLAVVGGVRSYLQLRRTGEVGLRIQDRRGSPQWWSRRISSLGLLLALAAPIAELAGLTAGIPGASAYCWPWSPSLALISLARTRLKAVTSRSVSGSEK